MSYTDKMLRDDALQGKVIVVTGGGSGLGKAMTKYFLELGAKVAITSRDLDKLKNTAQELINELESRKIRAPHPIITQVRPFEKFWIADDYHQNFYAQNQSKPYCQIVIDPKITKLRKTWADLLKDE